MKIKDHEDREGTLKIYSAPWSWQNIMRHLIPAVKGAHIDFVCCVHSQGSLKGVLFGSYITDLSQEKVNSTL